MKLLRFKSIRTIRCELPLQSQIVSPEVDSSEAITGDVKLKETRKTLLASRLLYIITIEVYALLFDENSPNNLDFPYYNRVYTSFVE